MEASSSSRLEGRLASTTGPSTRTDFRTKRRGDTQEGRTGHPGLTGIHRPEKQGRASQVEPPGGKGQG